jgi:hypothetical protein
MRFCRYCGVPIPEDSLFCPKCGKRLGRRPHPLVDKTVATLKLNTPYPYFIVLLAAAGAWFLLSRSHPAFDYSHIEWSVEPSARTGPDEDGAYHQNVWLVAENKGETPTQDIPVDLTIRIDPAAPAEITARFGGRNLALSAGGKPLPLSLILSDPIQAGSRRRFMLEGTIRAKPPFTVVYEFRDETRKRMLARYATEP